MWAHSWLAEDLKTKIVKRIDQITRDYSKYPRTSCHHEVREMPVWFGQVMRCSSLYEDNNGKAGLAV